MSIHFQYYEQNCYIPTDNPLVMGVEADGRAS